MEAGHGHGQVLRAGMPVQEPGKQSGERVDRGGGNLRPSERRHPASARVGVSRGEVSPVSLGGEPVSLGARE